LALIIALLVVLATVALLSHAATAAGPAKTMDIQFINHIQAGFAEQDVFVERNDIAPDQVARLEVNDAPDPSNLAKILFASAAATPHDPFKVGPTPRGPFAKGAPLGFTVQQWLAATGSGTYKVNAGQSEMKFAFQKLVPNGTYTLWCSRLTLSPNVTSEDIPDGSQFVFKADAQGNASFTLKLKALPDSTRETATVISVVYHSDGQTYGASQGDFGRNSHVQFFFMFPAPEPFYTPVPPTPAPTATPANTGGHSKGRPCGSCHGKK
jgi:hypothetical protein